MKNFKEKNEFIILADVPPIPTIDRLEKYKEAKEFILSNNISNKEITLARVELGLGNKEETYKLMSEDYLYRGYGNRCIRNRRKQGLCLRTC